MSLVTTTVPESVSTEWNSKVEIWTVKSKYEGRNYAPEHDDTVASWIYLGSQNFDASTLSDEDVKRYAHDRIRQILETAPTLLRRTLPMAGHAPSTTLREDEDDDPLPLPGVARLHEIGERRPAERRELYHRLSMSLACDSLGDGTRDTVHMHIRFPLSTPVPPDAHEVAIRTAAGMVEDSPQSRSAKFDGDEEWEAELEFEQANLTEYEDRGSATICVRSHEGIDAAGVREGQIVRYAERRARQILREARSVLAEAKPPRRQVRHQHFGVGWVIADHGAEVEVDFGDRGVWRIDRRYVVGDETAC